MKQFKKITLTLVVATLALTGCMGTKHLSHNISDEGRTQNSDDIVFPELGKAWQKDGQFPNSENLSKIRAGVGKDELYQLLGRPHFSEAHRAREWDYILKFYQPDESVKICQYKVIFNKNYKAQEFHWLPADCADYATIQPKETNVTITPVVPMVQAPAAAQKLHRDNFGIGADTLFAFDKWELQHMQSQGRAELDDLAIKILAYGDSINQVMVTGYTDRLGDDMYNINLSLLRAQTVREYLVSQGVDPNVIVATGNGKFTPTKECTDNQSRNELIDCLYPNRRVEVSVSYFK